MKFDHENKYLGIYVGEDFACSFSFINDLASGETVSSATVTCTDSKGTDTSSSMISTITISSPLVYFKVDGGTADTTYQIEINATTSGGANLIHYITLEVFGTTTLNTKLGDPNANSYVTIVEANAYIRNVRGHPNKWDTLSIEGKKRLLIEACKDINRFNFINPPYYANQVLAFPDSKHDTFSGDVATPITINSFANTNFTSDTYGAKKSNSNYWKYGSIHITSATPLYDIRVINTSNITTDVITVTEDFTATPTTNTDFRAFEPLDINIKNAQIIQALFLLDKEGNNPLNMYKNLAQEVEIGDTRVRFKSDANMAKISLAPESKKLLSRYIRKAIRIGRA